MAKAKSINDDVLQQAAEEYGKVKDKIKALEKTEAELKEILKKELKTGDIIYGKNYSVTLVQKDNIVLDPRKVLKKIGSKHFLDVVKVLITNSKKYMSLEDLDKAVESSTPSYSLTYKKIK